MNFVSMLILLTSCQIRPATVQMPERSVPENNRPPAAPCARDEVRQASCAAFRRCSAQGRGVGLLPSPHDERTDVEDDTH